MTSPSRHLRRERTDETGAQAPHESLETHHPSSPTSNRAPLRLAATLLAAFVFLAPTLAQQPSRPRNPPPAEIVNIDLGWGGSSLAAERWQPVTVWITSQEKAFTGALTITCQQDKTQNTAVHVAPVSTTPGQVTPVEVLLSPAATAGRISITLEGPGLRATHRYNRTPSADETPLPRIGLGEVGHVVIIGKTSAGKAVHERVQNLNPSAVTTPDNEYSEERALEQMIPSRTRLDRLPASWAAYESVDLVLCDEEEVVKADPRARAALSTWVRSGGRLVLRLDPVGPAWPALLGDETAFATASPQRVLSFGEDLAALLPRMASTTLKARAITITPAGLAHGWKPLFPVNDADNAAPAGSLAAHGPIGLGMVTLLAFEPAQASPLIDDEGIKKVWRSAMSPVLSPHAKSGGYEAANFWMMETADRETIGAINSGLDAIASVPPIGTAVFWAISGCVLILGVLLGPIDAKLLKRKGLSQHAWLSAIGWITLAGLGAILIPRVLRSAESRATRLELTDALCDRQGQPTHAAHYGLNGVFAGEPLAFSLTGEPDGAVLKGVSADRAWWSNDDILTLPDLHLAALTTGPADEPIRSLWAGDIDVPQWSFRTLSDSAPLAPARTNAIGAQVVTSNGLRYVRLTNLPAGATVTEALVGLHDGWRKVDLNGIAVPNQRDRDFLIIEQPASELSGSWLRSRGGANMNWNTPAGTPASLPWVRERTDAMLARIATGQWACVCVKIDGLPATLTLEGPEGLAIKQQTMLRLLTPLETE